MLTWWDSTYKANITESAPPEPYREDALRVDRIVHNGDIKTGEAQWYTWHAWSDPLDPDYPTDNASLIMNHITYCNTHDLVISAIGFGWCWDMHWKHAPGGGIDTYYDVRWAGTSVGGPDGDTIWGLDDEDYAITGNRVNMDDYLQATEEYITYVGANGYDTVVFFTTGPVDPQYPISEEAGYQREIKQQYIRDHFDDVYPDAILFDYADILTHNNEGEEYHLSWGDRPYPHIHPDNEMDYDWDWNIIPPSTGGDHIGDVGALRLGKAMWWLLARLAGWDGNPAPPPDTEEPVVTVISPDGGEKFKKDCQYDITWLATDNVSVTSCNISYSTNGGASYIDIATGEANDGTYSWIISGDLSETCLVKVAASDAAGNWGHDESDAAFEICDSIPGDANDDGVVTSLDITKAERIILELDSPTADANANGDEHINALDITTIERIILGY